MNNIIDTLNSTTSLQTWLDQNWTVLLVLLIWSLAWKGFALWRAALRQELYWFIAILILNTFGILEIIYLFWFAPKKVDVNIQK